MRFAGQYYDAETGLHYNYHRYYDPKLGRYLRVDPIGLAGGINPYVYVQNNPINWVDPYGLSSKNQYPSQRYNKPHKPIKVTPSDPKFVRTPAPEITPKNYNSKGINNLPGKKIPISERVGKGPKILNALIGAVRQISKFINNFQLIIMVDVPGMYPQELYGPRLRGRPGTTCPTAKVDKKSKNKIDNDSYMITLKETETKQDESDDSRRKYKG